MKYVRRHAAEGKKYERRSLETEYWVGIHVSLSKLILAIVEPWQEGGLVMLRSVKEEVHS